jgi:hypothetical protein
MLEDEHRLLIGLEDERCLLIVAMAEVEVVGLEVASSHFLVGEVMLPSGRGPPIRLGATAAAPSRGRIHSKPWLLLPPLQG